MWVTFIAILLRQRESSHKSFRNLFLDAPYMVHNKWYIISSKNSNDTTEGNEYAVF